MSDTYPNLAAYTADVEAARAAYRADETARQGLCVECEQRKRDGRHRRCWACRRLPQARQVPQCNSTHERRSA